MGSGYYPTNPKAAASISEINFIDNDGHATRVTEDLPLYESHPNMYGLSSVIDAQFFYGGPWQPNT